LSVSKVSWRRTEVWPYDMPSPLRKRMNSPIETRNLIRAYRPEKERSGYQNFRQIYLHNCLPSRQIFFGFALDEDNKYLIFKGFLIDAGRHRPCSSITRADVFP